jgi:hypothetical protein
MLLRAMNLPVYVAGPIRELGPYAVVAVFVPGGCLIALALWAFRHRASLVGRVRRRRELQKPVEPRFESARARKVDHWSGLNRITAIREAAHSCFDLQASAGPASAIVFLRAQSAARTTTAGTAQGRRTMRTIIKKGMTVLAVIGASTSWIAVTPLLASCASSGLYNMSDEWCARHADASAAHCPGNQHASAAGDDASLSLISNASGSRAGESLQRE